MVTASYYIGLGMLTFQPFWCADNKIKRFFSLTMFGPHESL